MWSVLTNQLISNCRGLPLHRTAELQRTSWATQQLGLERFQAFNESNWESICPFYESYINEHYTLHILFFNFLCKIYTTDDIWVLLLILLTLDNDRDTCPGHEGRDNAVTPATINIHPHPSSLGVSPISPPGSSWQTNNSSDQLSLKFRVSSLLSIIIYYYNCECPVFKCVFLCHTFENVKGKDLHYIIITLLN